MEELKSEMKPSPTVASGSDSTNDNTASVGSVEPAAGSHHLKRKLRSKEIQMYCMGTTIGTCTSDICDGHYAI